MAKVDIGKEDLDIIETIAKKYNVTVQDIGRSLLSRKYPRIQIMLTPEELTKIDENANRLNLSRSMYCYLCFRKAINDKIYEKMNIVDIVKKGKNGIRTEKVAVSFSELGDYNKMMKFAEDMGVSFSSVVRYFSLNVDLK